MLKRKFIKYVKVHFQNNIYMCQLHFSCISIFLRSYEHWGRCSNHAGLELFAINWHVHCAVSKWSLGHLVPENSKKNYIANTFKSLKTTTTTTNKTKQNKNQPTNQPANKQNKAKQNTEVSLWCCRPNFISILKKAVILKTKWLKTANRIMKVPFDMLIGSNKL